MRARFPFPPALSSLVASVVVLGCAEGPRTTPTAPPAGFDPALPVTDLGAAPAATRLSAARSGAAAGGLRTTTITFEGSRGAQCGAILSLGPVDGATFGEDEWVVVPDGNQENGCSYFNEPSPTTLVTTSGDSAEVAFHPPVSAVRFAYTSPRPFDVAALDEDRQPIARVRASESDFPTGWDTVEVSTPADEIFHVRVVTVEDLAPGIDDFSFSRRDAVRAPTVDHLLAVVLPPGIVFGRDGADLSGVWLRVRLRDPNDPGPWDWTINWGDRVDTPTGLERSGEFAFLRRQPYGESGTFTIAMTATDPSGATSPTAITTVTVP